MIDIKSLPKVPSEALLQLVSKALEIVPATGGNLNDLRAKEKLKYDELVVTLSIARKVALRLEDETVRGISLENLEINENLGFIGVRAKFQSVIEGIATLEIDSHFIDEALVEEFDKASIPSEAREEIRSYLQKAKNLAASAGFLTDPVRRSFLHKVSLAENELFKEHVGFQAFLAAAYEAGRLLRVIGNDAKPLAEAVEKARTKTERHVHGYEQIAAEEKPKSLPKPGE